MEDVFADEGWTRQPGQRLRDAILLPLAALPVEMRLPVLRRATAHVWEDKFGGEKPCPQAPANAEDWVEMFAFVTANVFAPNCAGAKAKKAIEEAVASIRAARSVSTGRASSPPPRPAEHQAAHERPHRLDAIAAVNALAREAAAGNEEEGAAPRQTAGARQTRTQTRREEAPHARTPTHRADTPTGSNTSDDEPSEDEKSTATRTTTTTTTTRRNIGKGSFRDKGVLYKPEKWTQPLATEGPHALNRALLKEFFLDGPPASFTDEVGLLCVDVLCLLAGAGADDTQEQREDNQADAATQMMRMLVRVRAAKTGATKAECEKLGRDLSNNDVPKEYREPLDKLDKKHTKAAEKAAEGPARRAPAPRTRPQYNQAPRTAPTNSGGGQYYDDAAWTRMSPAARAQEHARRATGRGRGGRR